jgi:hypothetical protein
MLFVVTIKKVTKMKSTGTPIRTKYFIETSLQVPYYTKFNISVVICDFKPRKIVPASVFLNAVYSGKLKLGKK